MGGLVSSAAETLSLSGEARSVPELHRPLALGMRLAYTVLYLRGLLLIALFDRPLAVHLAPRLLLWFAFAALLAAALGGSPLAASRAACRSATPWGSGMRSPWD